MAATADSTWTLRHLEAELLRLDLLLQREVRRWQLAGQDPSDHLRGLSVSDAEATAVLSRPFGASWGQTVELDSETTERFERATAEAQQQALAIERAALKDGSPSRLAAIRDHFGLDSFAYDTLLICLAPSLDLRYEPLYGFLQDDITRREPSVNLVLNLLCEAGGGRLLRLPAFRDAAPLIRYRLIERPGASDGGTPLLKQGLVPDPSVVAWLLGQYRPHAALAGAARLSHPQPDEGDHLMALAVQDELERAATLDRPLVVFYGPDDASQMGAASLLAAHRGQALLCVDLEAVVDAGTPPRRALQVALRDARLTGAIPYLSGWDTCLQTGTLPAPLLTDLCSYPDAAIVSGRSPWQAKGVDRDRPLFWLAFPTPEYAQRRALWHYFLSQRERVEANPDVRSLAGQFRLTAGQIRDAVASANDWAIQAGQPIRSSFLFQASRTHSSPNLAGLAHKIVPRFTWEDLILPPDQVEVLRELVATVRGRPVVLEEWGVGRKLASSAGITVLFAGPPGTGKTTAAEVIAGELGLDLYKIDLSTMVSKYIGETEKNLGRLFDEAESSNAILFFDEADAIFGKRSEVKDAHDRYANIEVSYLLQRMESYDGVTILATNLRANLDDAFTRRLQFAIDLPFPDETERLRIWESLFPTMVPRADDLDLPLLARRFKLAGGNIRNILVSAAYLAAADGGGITMAHLLHGTRRELQKMGRLVSDVDLSF